MRGLVRVLLAAAVMFFAAVPRVEADYLYVLYADATGNDIYGFDVNGETGVLSALPGSPWASGGVHDVGLMREMLIYSPAVGRLYAANSGSASISAFAVDLADGSLAPLPFSPIAIPNLGSWACLAVHPDGSPLMAANRTQSVVASYVVDDVSATPATGSPFATGTYSDSCALSADGQYFYTGSSWDEGLFAGFEINQSSGVLTPLDGSPYDPAWSGSTYEQNYGYATDAAGRLFMVTYSPSEILAFTTSAGIPTEVTGSPFATGLNPGSFATLHEAGYYMVVSGSGGNEVGVYAVAGSGSGTSLAGVAGSPFATGGSDARNMTLSTSGDLLFVAHNTSDNIATFAVDPATGGLTPLAIQPSGTLGSGTLCGFVYVGDEAIFADGFEGGGAGNWSVVVGN